jgi:hypothetical protein
MEGYYRLFFLRLYMNKDDFNLLVVLGDEIFNLVGQFMGFVRGERRPRLYDTFDHFKGAGLAGFYVTDPFDTVYFGGFFLARIEVQDRGWHQLKSKAMSIRFQIPI